MTRVLKVKADLLNIRSGPGTTFDVVDTANKGNLLFPIVGWVAIQLDDDSVGWVSAKYVEAVEEELEVELEEEPSIPAGKVPSWLTLARSKLGLKEIPGGIHNQEIVQFFDFTSYDAKSDEEPWCAAFVCAMLEMTGYRSTKSAAAISFKDWGIGLKEPKDGCVVVFPHHVGFYDGGKLLGGNQSNAVTRVSYDFSGAVGYRWPEEAA